MVIPEDHYTLLNNSSKSPQNDTKTVEDFFKVALLLAKVNAYNSDLHIRDENGLFLTETNVIELVEYLFDVKPHIKGIDEFANLLVEADIPDNFILNRTFKDKISLLRSSKKSNQSSDLPVHETLSGFLESSPSVRAQEDHQRQEELRNHLLNTKSKEPQKTKDWKHYDFYVPKEKQNSRKERKYHNQKWKKS